MRIYNVKTAPSIYDKKYISGGGSLTKIFALLPEDQYIHKLFISGIYYDSYTDGLYSFLHGYNVTFGWIDDKIICLNMQYKVSPY